MIENMISPRTKSAILPLLLLAMLLFSFSNRQLIPVSLRVTVLNELGNPEKGATVTVYNTRPDYEKEQNPAFPAQTTNDKGVAIFRNLQPMVYHISAVNGDKDNANGATQTDTLKASRQNKVNIIIE